MACYLVFYLAFFKLLEQGIQVPDLVLHCRLDDLIPFCKYAIIPYYLWFAWIPCTLFYLLWFNDRREFWRLCLPLFAGMTLSLMFCAIVIFTTAALLKWGMGLTTYGDVFNLINQVIGAFQAFNSSYLITKGKPLNTTLYYGVHLYNKAFNQFEMGYGSAMAWFMLLIIAFFTALIFRSSSAWVYYESEGR